MADAGNEVHARFAVIVQVLSNRGASTRLWQLELASASTQAEAGQWRNGSSARRRWTASAASGPPSARIAPATKIR